MMTWIKNFIEHPASTIQGLTGGAVLVAFLGYMASELHCDWSLFSFQNLVAFLIPVLIGGGAGTTNAKVAAQPKADA
jgi:hypothetical protein